MLSTSPYGAHLGIGLEGIERCKPHTPTPPHLCMVAGVAEAHIVILITWSMISWWVSKLGIYFKGVSILCYAHMDYNTCPLSSALFFPSRIDFHANKCVLDLLNHDIKVSKKIWYQLWTHLINTLDVVEKVKVFILVWCPSLFMAHSK